MENKRKEQLPGEVKAAKQQPLQCQLQGSDGTERSYELEDEEAALHYIRAALALDPEHQEARELMKALGH